MERFLTDAFLAVLNMSITGSFVIAGVLLARLLLRRAPKAISYALWAVVLLRLLCPFSMESALSLVPVKAQPVPPAILYEAVPRIDSGIPAMDRVVNNVLPPAIPDASVNPMQILTILAAYLWALAALVLLLYSVGSCLLLHRRVSRALLITDNIYECEAISSPFVLGIFRPRIYLPLGVKAEEYNYILLHEQTHIRRGDHLVKPIAFLTLCLHWFNPLCWAAFALSAKDMEMSCDEAVLRRLGGGVRKDYSESLLALAGGRRLPGGGPLAFGENSIAGRVKNILRYRSPVLWVTVVAVLAAALLSLGLLLSPKEEQPAPTVEEVLGVVHAAYSETGGQGEDRDGFLSKAQSKLITDAVGKLKVPVTDGHSDMRNHQQVADFCKKVEQGGSGSLTVYEIIRNPGALAYTFTAVDGVTELTMTYDFLNEEGQPSVAQQGELSLFTYTDNGYLLCWAKKDAEDGSSYRGMRVAPLGQKMYDFTEKYIFPLPYYLNLYNRSWSGEDLAVMNWDFLFDALYQTDSKGGYMPEDFPLYGGDNYTLAVPAETVERVLQSYFEVSTEQLRASGEYDAARGVYAFAGFRGGGYSPSQEVVASVKNPDGTLTLTVNSVAVDFGRDADGTCSLTVRPMPDGSFRYLGNTVADGADALTDGEITDIFTDLLARAETVGTIWSAEGFTTTPTDYSPRLRRIDPENQPTPALLELARDYNGVFRLKDYIAMAFGKSLSDTIMSNLINDQYQVYQDSEEGLLIDTGVGRDSFIPGRWLPETMTVVSSAFSKLVVEMDTQELSPAQGQKTRRQLTAVDDGYGRWRLTEDYLMGRTLYKQNPPRTENAPEQPTPANAGSEHYQKLVENKAEIVSVVNQRVAQYRNGTPPDNPNHHPPYPTDFPTAAQLPAVVGAEQVAIREEADLDPLGAVYAAVSIDDTHELRMELAQAQAADGTLRWGSGNTWFSSSAEGDYYSWVLADVNIHGDAVKPVTFMERALARGLTEEEIKSLITMSLREEEILTMPMEEIEFIFYRAEAAQKTDAQGFVTLDFTQLTSMNEDAEHQWVRKGSSFLGMTVDSVSVKGIPYNGYVLSTVSLDIRFTGGTRVGGRFEKRDEGLVFLVSEQEQGGVPALSYPRDNVIRFANQQTAEARAAETPDAFTDCRIAIENYRIQVTNDSVKAVLDDAGELVDYTEDAEKILRVQSADIL